MTEDETVGEHHQLNRQEFEQTLEESEGQRRLACCSPWGHNELDTTQQMNNNNKSSGSSVVLDFTFRAIINFELIFFYMVQSMDRTLLLLLLLYVDI